MLKLNRDVLYIISEKFQNDSVSLYSFLLVNRIWCEVAVPILWKIPGRIPLTEKAKRILFNVILSHLSEDSRDILKKQGIDDLFTETFRPPSFNYINLWRYLDLELLKDMIKLRIIKETNDNIIIDELLKLFVNKNNNFISLFIPLKFEYQIHNISWAEQCFSNLEFLHCDSCDKNIVKGLAIIARSIKKLIYTIDDDDISDSLILIGNQNNLNEIQIECFYVEQREIIIKTLIKKAATIQHLQMNWIIEEEFLSYFVNLSSLKMGEFYRYTNKTTWLHLEKETSPVLKVLKANIYFYLNLDKMIKIVGGHLVVIAVWHNGLVFDVDYNRRLIQAIYQNCSNVRYLNMPMKEANIPEFEKLLINCQNLSGLIIENELSFSYKSLFEVLTRSSPISLNKFKFCFNRKYGPKFKILRSFLGNWKNRFPMFLQIDMVNFDGEQEIIKLEELVKNYEVKGIVQKWDFYWSLDFEEFEWIKKNSDFY